MKTEGYGIEIRAVKWTHESGYKLKVTELQVVWDNSYESRESVLADFKKLTARVKLSDANPRPQTETA